MRPAHILIGIAAGFAAALLFAGLVLQSTTAVVLALAAPIPIFIASLGWGSVSGAVAAVVAGLALGGLMGAPASGLLLFASIALPAAVVGHIAGLARPRESAAANDDRPAAHEVPFPRGSEATDARADSRGLDWFPVSRILFAIALAATAAGLFVGWLIGYDPSVLGGELAGALSSQLGAGAEASDEQIRQLAALLVRLVPYVQPALLVLVMVLGLYVAAWVVRLSGRMARPRDDLPSSAGLPRAALGVFGAGLLLSFAPGNAGLVGAVVVGTFGTAFTLAGLAAIHRRTRAMRSRGLLLFAFYMAIVFVTLPLLAATILGVVETARRPSTARTSA